MAFTHVARNRDPTAKPTPSPQVFRGPKRPHLRLPLLVHELRRQLVQAGFCRARTALPRVVASLLLAGGLVCTLAQA